MAWFTDQQVKFERCKNNDLRDLRSGHSLFIDFKHIVTLSLSSQYSISECSHNNWIIPVYTNTNITTNITV